MNGTSWYSQARYRAIMLAGAMVQGCLSVCLPVVLAGATVQDCLWTGFLVAAPGDEQEVHGGAADGERGGGHHR
jgi:hypothetical protein